jgi:hypothetical protein
MAGIMNLTQHAASPEQQAAGVIDLPDAARDLLVRLLTFEDLPKAADIEVRAAAIARLATDLWREWEAGRAPAQTHLSRCVMIGGAPYLMSALERALALQGFKAIYAFSGGRAQMRCSRTGRCGRSACSGTRGLWRWPECPGPLPEQLP